ncbi:MAG: uL30 family ribosomal protein [Nanoarchaeota archaeon]|nr:uL30 family ribosomal protein [Nanoarchaeota archaeon]
MITVIRISGKIGLRKPIEETLYRLRIRRKYSCIVLTNPTKEQLGMIQKVRDFVAFGEIKKEMFEKLIKSRGLPVNKTKKLDEPKKIISELEKGKKYEELNLKPFFRLHSPRKGIKSKLHFPKGVLGNNKEKINELIERML